MFGRRPNQLCQALAANKNMPLDDVLMHSDFATTWKTGDDVFLEYLREKDPKQGHIRMHIVIDYALTLDKTEQERPRGNIRTPHREAALALSEASRKLVVLANEDDYLAKALEKFYKSPMADNPLLAGRVARIIDLQLHAVNESKRSAFNPETMINFLLNHVHVLAYSHLLGALLVFQADFIAKFPGGVSKCLERILEKAKENAMKSKSSSVFYEMQVERQVQTLKQKRSWTQPLMCDKKPFPWPDYGTPAQQKRTTSLPDDPEMTAYLLLSTLSNSLRDNPELLRELQNEKCLEHLLICGINSSDASMVGVKAFRIVELLLFGMVTEENEFTASYKIPGQEEKLRPIIQKFAQKMKFGGHLTPKQIAAFPCFWDCRFKDLRVDYGNLPLECELPLGGSEKPKTYTVRPPRDGASCVEYYAKYLLDEPPLSDTLNRSIVDVWRRMDEESTDERSKEFQSEQDEYKALQAVMDKYDSKFIRFLLVKVRDKTMRQMLAERIPLFPCDKKGEKLCQGYSSLKKSPRACLNGHVVDFHSFCSRSCVMTWQDLALPLLPDDQETPAVILEYEDLLEKSKKDAPESIFSLPLIDKSEKIFGL